MRVRLLAYFNGEPAAENEADLRSLANSLSNDEASINVLRLDSKPDALVIEFTMPAEAQYHAVDKIDAGLHFWCLEARDTVISFPNDRPARKRRPGKKLRGSS